jgi:hypothetical protein
LYGINLLTTVHFILRDDKPYRDLGPNHFTHLNPQQRSRYRLRQAPAVG